MSVELIGIVAVGMTLAGVILTGNRGYGRTCGKKRPPLLKYGGINIIRCGQRDAEARRMGGLK